MLPAFEDVVREMEVQNGSAQSSHNAFAAGMLLSLSSLRFESV